MPAGEDKVRTKYYSAGVTHPNRKTKKQVDFNGNNWPSIRTFYSNVSVEVIIMAKRFDFYARLAGVPPTSGKYLLEKISEEIGYPVSNYTIEGLTNQLWGPRHNPKPKTIEAILHLTAWLEKKCREHKLWKPFKFCPHPDDKQKKQTHENKNNQKRVSKTSQKGCIEERESIDAPTCDVIIHHFRQKGRRC